MGFRRWPRHQDSRVEAKTCRIWPPSIESLVLLLSNSATPIADGVGQLLVPVTFSRGVSGQPAQNAEYLISQTLVNNAEGWHITTIMPVANTQTPTLASESDPRTGHPAGSVVTLMRDFRFVFRQMRGKSEVTVVNRPL